MHTRKTHTRWQIYAAVLSCYARYASASPYAQIRPRAGTSVSLTCPIVDQAYLCPINLSRDPGQSFRMLFDTGSPVSWVHSKYASAGSTPDQDIHQYNPSNWDVVRDADGSPQGYIAPYIDGTLVSGVVVRDDLSFGNDLVLSGGYLGAATRVGDLAIEDMDGLLGFGFQDKDDDYEHNHLAQKPSVWDALVGSKTMSEGCFTVDANDPKSAQINIGSTDSSKMRSPQKFATGTKDGHWIWDTIWFLTAADTSTPHQLGGSDVDGITIDTGADIYLPDAIVSDYWAQIQDQSQVARAGNKYLVRCDANPPDLTIVQAGSIASQLSIPGFVAPTGSGLIVNGPKITIPGRYLKVKWYNSEATNWCWGGVQPSIKPGVSILGQRMFRAMYAEFCVDNSGQNPYITMDNHMSPNMDFVVERSRSIPQPDDQVRDPEANDSIIEEDEGADEEYIPPHDPDNPFAQPAEPDGDGNGGGDGGGGGGGGGAPTIDGLDAAAFGLSGASAGAIFGSLAAGVTAAGLAIGLGIGFGISHNKYNDIVGDDETPSGAWNISGTNLHGDLQLFQTVDNNDTFTELLNVVQGDFQAGKGPSVANSNYSGTYQDLQLIYQTAIGSEQTGVDGFNGTLGLLQWLRIDGLHNYLDMPLFPPSPPPQPGEPTEGCGLINVAITNTSWTSANSNLSLPLDAATWHHC